MASSTMKQGLSQRIGGLQGISNPKPTHLKVSSAAQATRSPTARKALLAPVRAAGVGAAEEVPDMEKRKTMNLVLAGGVSLPVASLAGPFLSFLYPPSGGGGGGAQSAKDILGADIKAADWLRAHSQPGARELTQGLKGDPTYLVTGADGTSLVNYGINAVCTHLGCVVPWMAAENKFICPCHGSQYNDEGKVVRGPAPLSLALAHADVGDNGVVNFSPWTETDFRTETEPWWA